MTMNILCIHQFAKLCERFSWAAVASMGIASPTANVFIIPRSRKCEVTELDQPVTTLRGHELYWKKTYY